MRSKLAAGGRAQTYNHNVNHLSAAAGHPGPQIYASSQTEIDSIWQLANARKKHLVQRDDLILGFNFGVHSGAAAG
jgi:hypothetical protein